MNLFNYFLDEVKVRVERLVGAGALPAGLDFGRIAVEPTRDPAHGDISTNAAMVLAKPAGKNPRELAELVADALREHPAVTSADVAGPGFVNLRLGDDFWHARLAEIVRVGPAYGDSTMGGGEKVNVEYVSANPTGPLHVGHARGAVVGDVLATLLEKTGYAVCREYYINDGGAQVDVLARSTYLRYREALGEDIGAIPQGLYPGDYLKPVGADLAARYGASLRDKPEAEWLPLVRDRAIDMMMADIRDDLLSLNVVHDVFFSERSLIEGPRDQVGETIAALRRAGDVYEGRLPPPKGAPMEDWEDREQTLFRATAFGDDVDRPLMKSDGSYTYFASDIAYHKNKVDRGFASMIDVWGADHGGYIRRVQAAVNAVRAITNAAIADLDVKIVQLVKVLRGGEPVKMSKRAGEFVTLRDVVDEVGKDAVRFMMLFRKNDAALDFDLAKVIEQSRDNPVFYVQYGHARGRSVFRNAREVVSELPSEPAAARAFLIANAPLERLEDSGELALMRRLALYPRLLEAAAIAHEPHRIAFYLYDLASDFHTQWNRGNDASYLRFIIQNDPEMTMARLALVEGVVSVLASGLRLLGVEAPEEMR